jgi:Tol biopolymer transport system component
MATEKPGPDPTSGEASYLETPPDRLDSWKEISAYFKRDIRTVQRWETLEGMPVHRHMHGEQGSVYAYRAELDTWQNNCRHRFGPQDDAAVAVTPVSAGGEAAVAPVPQTQDPRPDHGVREPAPALESGGEPPQSKPGLPDSAGGDAAVAPVPQAQDRRPDHGVRELAPALESGGESPQSKPAQVGAGIARPREGRALPYTRWSAIVAAVVVLGAGIAFLLRPTPAPRITGYAQLTSDGRPKAGPLLSDGSRLYFIERTPEGASSLVSVSTAGGDPSTIATPFRQFGLFDISPRRSELLISTPEVGGPAPAGSALWILPLPSGTPRRVGDLVVYHAAWSPDSERLAYTKGPDLYMATGDGSDSRKLVTLPAQIVALSWSPDGRTLRLGVCIPGREASAFWDVAPDGTGLHRILPGWERAVKGAWTPDGTYFLFSVGPPEPGRRSALWAFRDRRSLFQETPRQPTQLAPTGPLELVAPVLSLDGKKIFVLGTQNRPELTRFDTRVREFVPYLGGIAAVWASFSRDSKWVAYLSLPQHALWRARADGSEPVQLTFAPLVGDGLAWSPDGKQIALRAQMPGKPWKVYLVPGEGGAAVPLTAGEKDEGIPTWSEDGKKIVFGDVPPVFGQDDGHHALHVVNVETRQVSDLPDSKGLWTSRWSPDGRYVAALTITSQRLRLFDFTIRKWRALADLEVDNPAWSRDGKYIYFNSAGENPNAIYRVRISDGKVERIASLAGIKGAAPWGCGLAPDDSPLITREVGFTEVYALDFDPP